MKNLILIVDKILENKHIDLLKSLGEGIFTDLKYVEVLTLSNDEINLNMRRINKALVNKDKIAIIASNSFNFKSLCECIDYNEHNKKLEIQLIQIDESENKDDYALNKQIFADICNNNNYIPLSSYLFSVSEKDNEYHDITKLKLNKIGKDI